MDFLFQFHSGWRYLVLLAGVVTIALALPGLRGNRIGEGVLRAVRIFAIVLDVQVLIGIALLALRPFVPQVIGHLVMMVAAVAVAHLLSVTLKKRPPERRTAGLALAGIGICLALVVAGILALGRPIV